MTLSTEAVTANMTPQFLLQHFRRLRFPWLFAVTAVLFGVDLIVPDIVPFVDELLLGLSTMLLGAWRVKKTGAKTIDTERVSEETEA